MPPRRLGNDVRKGAGRKHRSGGELAGLNNINMNISRTRWAQYPPTPALAGEASVKTHLPSCPNPPTLTLRPHPLPPTSPLPLTFYLEMKCVRGLGHARTPTPYTPCLFAWKPPPPPSPLTPHLTPTADLCVCHNLGHALTPHLTPTPPSPLPLPPHLTPTPDCLRGSSACPDRPRPPRPPHPPLSFLGNEVCEPCV